VTVGPAELGADPDASRVHLRVEPGLFPIAAGRQHRQSGDISPPRHERKPITMLAIIALVVFAIVAVAVFSLAVHVLFSPWLLLVAVGILVWVKFRPRHSRR
jgi:Flp pilus assembly protein TadB